jgi:hypothetical protein
MKEERGLTLTPSEQTILLNKTIRDNALLFLVAVGRCLSGQGMIAGRWMYIQYGEMKDDRWRVRETCIASDEEIKRERIRISRMGNKLKKCFFFVIYIFFFFFFFN